MAPSPFEQLINILSGTTPPSNLDKKLRPLVYEAKISADQLLRAANRAIHYQTAEVLELVPWAGHAKVGDLRRRMLETVKTVHDLNTLDVEGNWEVEHKAWTQDVILEAVVLRRECHDLYEQLKKEQGEEST